MIHTVRGRASAWTNAGSDSAPVAPSRGERLDGGSRDVVDDAGVARPAEAPHHVGAHTPEPDHAELHHSLLCVAATAAMTAAPALVESFTYAVSIRPARSPPTSSIMVSRTSASKPG